MFSKSLQSIKQFLLRYAFMRDAADMLSRTPSHATHWYLLLLVGLCITIANVAMAWFVFNTIQNNAAAVFDQEVTATTIKRDDLAEALETYRARAATIETVQVAPPSIIDPGR